MLASAAIALASSETLSVGLGVLPAPPRNVVTAAIEIATHANTAFSTVLFLACGAHQAAESAGSFLEAGVDTLVFQPTRPRAEMPD